jgi:peptide/nickel transport system ATP-binding protein
MTATSEMPRNAVPDPGERGVFAPPSSFRMPWGQATDARIDASTLPDDIVLSVRDLTVAYRVRRGAVKAVRRISFDLRRGETLALIGESGSGKTTVALALVRLLVRAARITDGSVVYRRGARAVDVLRLGAAGLRHYRWNECAMVFQSALNALNPVIKVRDQFLDVAKAHGMTDRRAAEARALELLRLVQLDADRVAGSYPHELSGGMRQRVLIAMGLLLDPQVIILDEPTTALDILTQRTVIDLLRRLKDERQFALVLVSHDLALAAELADQVATVYAGRIVECGTVTDMFYNPHHPYTLGLLNAVPTLSGDFRALDSVRGQPPDLIDLPPGCAFRPRCPFGTDECEAIDPEVATVDPARSGMAGAGGHVVACLHADAVAKTFDRHASVARK